MSISFLRGFGSARRSYFLSTVGHCTMSATVLKVFSRSIVILLMASVFAREANCTWKLLFSNPQSGSYKFCSGFFLDEKTGFIGADGQQGVFKTVDSGVTWHLVPLTPAPAAYPGVMMIPIQDIRMTTRSHGWLSLEDAVGPAVYETIDGGDTWIGTSYRGDCGSVYQTPAAVIVTNRGIGGGGAVSMDSGKTFTHLQILDSTNGIAFVDDLHGVVTGFFDTTWSRTADGGLTWQKSWSAIHNEAWSVYGASGTPNFYVAGENNWARSPLSESLVVRSTDYGATWSKLTNLPFRGTGHIAGVEDSVLYIQAASDDANLSTGPLSMYRSTDQGRRWVTVGGPSRRCDTRFMVLGDRGEVVIAFDDLGNVWKTTDGGDGALAPKKIIDSTKEFVIEGSRTASGIQPSSEVPWPNPVGSGEIEIPFRAMSAVTVVLSLTDATGREVLADRLTMHQDGMAAFRVQTASLADGVYHYVIRSLNGEPGLIEGKFVVLK